MERCRTRVKTYADLFLLKSTSLERSRAVLSEQYVLIIRNMCIDRRSRVLFALSGAYLATNTLRICAKLINL
ncbi:hypothetical protein BDV24DRAFT_124939 [Aspergillus arachidicola]|uniref:Uncharacterized protein n=1 Tax=Aspergillus arachidicola TaxID=656916 RepID=A0A5N6YKF7_9EURO|nr:hypothetical protein BDV24DRAFT_124939 [Aspergillus arachidicola]